MLAVAAADEHTMNDLEVRDRRWVDVEDRDRFGLPERDEIQAVQTADDADHVNVLASLGRDGGVVAADVLKLCERAVLIAVVSAVEDVFRMVVIHLPIESSRCFYCHVFLSSLCSLCVLCVSVVNRPLTTETQRTQRLHREELS